MRLLVLRPLPLLVALCQPACLDWKNQSPVANEAATDIDSDDADAAGALDGDLATEDGLDAGTVEGDADGPERDAAGEADDASTTIIDDADAPEAGGDDASVDAAVEACPSDACPAAFPCEGTSTDFICRGQFAEFPMPSRRAGTSLEAQRYEVDVAQGTVLDRTTGLMWQRTFVSPPLTHADAREYCRTLPVGGYGDFRLPSVHEIITLFGTEVAAEIDSTVFINVPYTFSYWTTTPDAERENPGYFSLFFMEYALSPYDATEMRGALCVRTHTRMTPAGTPDSRFVPEENGALVRDTHTAIVWERDLPLGRVGLTFAQAQAHCAALNTGGHTFRLPSLPEALSIYDYSKPTGMRIPAPFTGRNAALWTRTQANWNSERGVDDRWFVSAPGWIGVSNTADPVNVYGARCVAAP